MPMASEKILIVEDNAVNLELMQEILTAKGYRVASVKDGLDVREAAMRERPDLILMDLQLPGLDGYEATKAIKADPFLCRIPIMAVTSYALKGDREKALDAGCDSYMCKPIDAKKLLSDIRSLLDHKP